jgi:hypothetical protein
MDDAAILATRERLREERKRLFDEDDKLLIELKAIPLTTIEQEKQEEKKQQEALEEEQKRLHAQQQDRCFKGTLIFFGTCIVVGIIFYITGGLVAKHIDNICGMEGPVFYIGSKESYPAKCGNGFFTAGIVIFIIGISPILIACAAGAGQGGGGC